MFLMRVLEAVMAGGVVVGALAVWRPCSASSSRSLRVLRWVIVVIAALGVGGLCGAASLKVSLRTAFGRDTLADAAPPLLEAAIACGIIVLAASWVLTLVRLGVPRFRTRSTWSLKFDAVALTLCLALLVTSLELPFETHPRLTPEQRVALLDRSLRALEDGDREMPRDTWDPDYVVKMVGRDPQRLFRWVQQNTFWIPYHGVLRGPVGVLMDRQGNSLDRAILLATLLEKAGYTIRLAHGELERQQAFTILPTLVAERQIAFAPQPAPATTNLGIEQVAAHYQLDGAAINETVQSQRESISRISTELHARLTDQADRLLKAIDRPKEEEVWARTFSAALAALTDHWWVQREYGGNWLDLDLLADRGKPGTALAGASQTAAVKDLPDEMHHKITVRVIAEQWASGKLKEYKALEQPLRPADLIGQDIALQFWPTEWIANEGTTAPKRAWKLDVLAQKEWDAVLAIGGSVLASATIPDSGDDPYSQRGGALGGLASAFSASINLSSHEGNKTLSAVWLEYEFSAPGEKPRTVRRTVFDLLGPAARARSSPQLALDDAKRLTRSLALTMQTEFLPLPCVLSPEFVTHLLAQNLLTNRDFLEFLLRGTLPANTSKMQNLLVRVVPPLSSLYSLALARMEWAKQDEIFIERPNLLTRHLYTVPSGEAAAVRDATDIVANEVGVSVAVHDGFAARLGQGVLDTNAESLVRNAVTFGNAADAFSTSNRWKAYRPNQDTSLAKLKVPDDVHQQITRDLSAGYAVVAPEAPIPMPREPFSGWWRIDPVSGDVLGLGANGWGTELEEETPQNARTARTAPRWKRVYAKFASFFRYSAENYAWCVAPMVAQTGLAESVIKDGRPLGIGMGIWEGAIKPSWTSTTGCGPMSIAMGGISAWLLPSRIFGRVAAALRGLRGLKGPKGLPEPPAGGLGGPKAPPEPPLGGAGGSPRAGGSSRGEGKPSGGAPNETGGPPDGTNPEPNAEPNPSNPPDDDPCSSTEPAGGTPEPTPNFSSGEPVNPDTLQQETANQEANVARAQSALEVAKENTHQASANLDAAEKNWDALKAANSPKEVLDAAAIQEQKAAQAKLDAMQAQRDASKALDEEVKVQDNLQQLQSANKAAWDAQQKLQQAHQALTDWQNAHPDAQGLFDTPEWKNYSDSLAQYRNAQRQLRNTYWGGECGGSSTQPDPGSTQPDLGTTQPDLGKTQPDLGKTQPDLGSTQPDLGKTQPDLGKTQPDLGKTAPGTAGTAPQAPGSVTDPNGPPTVRDPNMEDNLGKTQPGVPPTQRSPQNSGPSASPAQKTLVGLGGALGALGGR